MECVAILDGGSQYGKLIDKTIRKLHYRTEIFPLDTKADILKSFKAIIISGSPGSVTDKDALKYDENIFKLNIPILGICYGMQLINYYYGGIIDKKGIREDGQYSIKVDKRSSLFENMEEKQLVLLTHGDSIITLAKDFRIIAESKYAISAIEHIKLPIYGVQFHPEVNLTINGGQIFRNFLNNIARLKSNYTIENRINLISEELKDKIGKKKTVVLVSGGVDSTVCAKLLYNILDKDQIFAIHIDNGFMRMNESKDVRETFQNSFCDIDIINARDNFYNGTTIINGKETAPLYKVKNPEIKRKIIGDTFIKIIMEKIKELGLKDYFLAQGTLRPDLIESASELASQKADTIKTHHNDTELVREKRKEGRIIEPLKDFHKDEVRELGLLLNVKKNMIWRHPFPGPGLAIRILCSDKPYITDKFDEINKILKEKFSDEDINAILLPIQSVGIQGDKRTYSYVVGLSGKLNPDKLMKIAKRIPKEIHEVNRVVYIFGDKVEKSIKKITPTLLNEDSIKILRSVDYKINEEIKKYKSGFLMSKLNQIPIILSPISFDENDKRSIIIRPFITNDFMTGLAAKPGYDFPLDLLEIINKKIINNYISRIMYDLTSKPPGTTEWE